MKANKTSEGNNHHSFHGKLSCSPAALLNIGNTMIAMIVPIKHEKKLYNNDSVRNCLMRLLLDEPTTFLTPTSFARLAERAVERFKKFIQANSKMKAAIAANKYTKRMSPCFTSSC